MGSGRGNWTLILGPGSRMRTLGGALQGLSQSGGGSSAPSLEYINDPGEIQGLTPVACHLVLDTDALAIEDVGLFKQFLRAHPGSCLTITGVEDRVQAARSLRDVPGATWLSWPPDLEQLRAILTLSPRPQVDLFGEPPIQRNLEEPGDSPAPKLRPGSGASPAPAQDADHAPSRSLSELRELEDDLQAIEQILSSGAMDLEASPLVGPTHPEDPGALALTPEEIEAFFEPGHAEGVDPPPPLPEPGHAPGEDPVEESDTARGQAHSQGDRGLTPPPWYKDQVADLADWAQRLSLAGAPSGFKDQALAQDVLGLTQFARTLGFLASPPARGGQVIDLETVLEELLAGLAGAREGSPRYLFRPNPGASVLSDKALLCTALDALLQLADACSGPDDVVRVALEPDSGSSLHQIRIQFPAGPLVALPPGEILAPYALKRLVPQIGPNALAAAGRILQGQGGDLAIGEGPTAGERLLVATLPTA